MRGIAECMMYPTSFKPEKQRVNDASAGTPVSSTASRVVHKRIHLHSDLPAHFQDLFAPNEADSSNAFISVLKHSRPKSVR
jgi:hypothetical protein